MSNYGLDLIKKLHPIKFRYDESKFEGQIDRRIHFGLSAQELEKILPINDFAIVNKDKNGFLMVKYDELISPLISSVKELCDRVEELEGQIKTLKEEK
jgi:hypothetical protein